MSQQSDERVAGAPPSAEAPADEGAALTYLGSATTLLRLGAFTVLTDPDFLRRGQRAYLGAGRWTRRLTDPAIGAGALPNIDVVVLSSLRGLRAEDASLGRVPVLTTPYAEPRLRRRGFDAHGLRTWTRWRAARPAAGRVEELVVEALPAVQPRRLFGRSKPQVMGSLIEHWAAGVRIRRVLVTGETLAREHLDQVRERHPVVDLAVVRLGGGPPPDGAERAGGSAGSGSSDGARGADLLRGISPSVAVPVHYEDYPSSGSPLESFLGAAERAGLGGAVRVIGRGDTLIL